MSVRSALTVRRALWVVLAVGLFGFVAFHSFLLGESGVQLFSLAESAWFVGLALVAATLAYATVTEPEPAVE